MGELKYSEAAAQRRIDAMWALEANPEIEEKIQDGTLNLSVVANAQRFFRHEAKVAHAVDRAEVFRSLENKSAREAERELLAQSASPVTLRAERVTAKTEELSELRMMVDREFLTDLEKLKGLLAHKNPNFTMAEILKEALRCTLTQMDPAREPKRKTKVRESEPLPTSETRTPSEMRRTRPGAATTREVWRRAQNRCEFAGCGSCFGLEVDHIVEIARGGTHELGNLRLLCFQHNQYAAERTFGREFMAGKRAQAN